jgi:transposase
MARQWVTDELWNEIASLLPAEPPKPKGGRPRVPDRNCLVGIAFVLRTGCAWNDLPAELGCGDGSTCWRRLRQWTEGGNCRGPRHRDQYAAVVSGGPGS